MRIKIFPQEIYIKPIVVFHPYPSVIIASFVLQDKALCQGKIGTDEHRRARCKRLRVGKLTKKLILAKPENRCGTGLLRQSKAQKTDEKADKIRGNDR